LQSGLQLQHAVDNQLANGWLYKHKLLLLRRLLLLLLAIAAASAAGLISSS
jgi:hypothetical protein